jgi:orotate phosphoribosyltransferase
MTLEIFRQAGAVLDGHFLLASGLHSSGYFEKFQVLQWPRYTERLCAMIADQFRGAGIEVVAGPTTGGVILAYDVARRLDVRGIFAERVEGGRAFRRGFKIRPGERVLVVDDVLTTGGSVREVVDAVRLLEGEVIAVAVLVDRSTGVDFGAPLYSLLRLSFPTYPPDQCPLCARGLPLTKPGSS